MGKTLKNKVVGIILVLMTLLLVNKTESTLNGYQLTFTLKDTRLGLNLSADFTGNFSGELISGTYSSITLKLMITKFSQDALNHISVIAVKITQISLYKAIIDNNERIITNLGANDTSVSTIFNSEGAATDISLKVLVPENGEYLRILMKFNGILFLDSSAFGTVSATGDSSVIIVPIKKAVFNLSPEDIFFIERCVIGLLIIIGTAISIYYGKKRRYEQQRIKYQYNKDRIALPEKK